MNCVDIVGLRVILNEIIEKIQRPENIQNVLLHSHDSESIQIIVTYFNIISSFHFDYFRIEDFSSLFDDQNFKLNDELFLFFLASSLSANDVSRFLFLNCYFPAVPQFILSDFILHLQLVDVSSDLLSHTHDTFSTHYFLHSEYFKPEKSFLLQKVLSSFSKEVIPYS